MLFRLAAVVLFIISAILYFVGGQDPNTEAGLVASGLACLAAAPVVDRYVPAP